MPTISLRLNQEEEIIFKNYSNFTGEPLSTLLKNTLLEKIEDEYDLKLIAEYEEDKKKGNFELTDYDDAWRELGL